MHIFTLKFDKLLKTLLGWDFIVSFDSSDYSEYFDISHAHPRAPESAVRSVKVGAPEIDFSQIKSIPNKLYTIR